ncbi:hypothetical protein Tco_1094678 [Tanacetum coccineum]|uniref:Uncharacterized protein n=1 Tax=Tanacetum coccineum TaxID=301880 RepID=A0ABQ5IGM3_9ASTR
MHLFDPSCEIANSSICIFPRVKFSPHDPIVHHSGHDIKISEGQCKAFDMLCPMLHGLAYLCGASVQSPLLLVLPLLPPSPSLGPLFRGSSSSHMISMNITSPSSSLEQTNFELEDWGTNPSDSSIEFNFCTCSMAIKAKGSDCGLELVFPRLPSSCSMSGSLT